jgi:hypothetical protein
LTELKKSWKSFSARLVAWKRALPVPGSTLIADGGTAIVQNRPDGVMPGSQSWC